MPERRISTKDAARAQGVTIEPGDALAVYSGRETSPASPTAPRTGT
jgi:hypothetical protein